MTTPFHAEADSFLGRADVVGLDSLFSAEEKAVALKVRGFVDEHILSLIHISEPTRRS